MDAMVRFRWHLGHRCSLSMGEQPLFVQFAPVGSHVIISADDSMKVNIDLTEDCQAILSIEAEPEEMEESLGLAYRKLVKKVNVPGFRKGKVPRDLFERYVGRGALIEEAVEHLVPELLRRPMRRPMRRPRLNPLPTLISRFSKLTP
jgi:hypothetical protein